MTAFQKRLWIGLGVMAALTPLGIILPERLGAGGAWGEWGADSIRRMLGYAPKGLERLGGLWKAPLPAYLSGWESASPAARSIAYIASGVVGIALAGLLVFMITKALLKHRNNER